MVVRGQNSFTCISSIHFTFIYKIFFHCFVQQDKIQSQKQQLCKETSCFESFLSYLTTIRQRNKSLATQSEYIIDISSAHYSVN